jgi:hypothetical protein
MRPLKSASQAFSAVTDGRESSKEVDRAIVPSFSGRNAVIFDR